MIRTVILLFLSLQFLHANASISITKKQTAEILLPNCEYIADSSKNISEILTSKSKLFKPFTGKLEAQKAYWFRISLENKTTTTEWFLLFDAIEYAQLYEPINQREFLQSEYGSSVAEQLKPSSNPFSEAMPITIAPQDTKTVYLFVKPGIEIYNHQANLSIISKDEFLQNRSYRELLYGIMYGLLLMLFLVGITMALGIKDNALIFYALFIGLFSAFLFTSQGFTGCYIFPWWSGLKTIAPLVGFLSLLSFLQFLRLFSNTRVQHPLIDSLVRYWILFSCIAIGIIVSLLFINPKLYFWSHRIFHILNQLLGIVVLIPLFKKNNRHTQLFLISSLALLIGSIIYTAGSMLGISSKQMLPAMQWGFIVQVILLAFALIYRYRNQVTNTNEMQAALIEELIDKDIQQQEQNNRLEETVLQRTHELQQRNTELNRINTRYREGIHAAATLQKNLFPSKVMLEKRFAGSFVWCEPIQEIGGDFYWFHETQRGQMLLAVADCTGHGVPGALTAIMGRDFLDEVVTKQNELWPDKILQNINKRFIERFKDQEYGEVRFGMDISIVLFDRQTRRVWFSGARQHMLIARGNEIERVRGDLFGIGDNIHNHKYTLHDFSLAPTDTIYLFTDGFQHQLNAISLKKYGGKRLRSFLASIISLPLAEQKKLFEAEWLQWKTANGEQTDDILVIACMLLKGKTEGNK